MKKIILLLITLSPILVFAQGSFRTNGSLGPLGPYAIAFNYDVAGAPQNKQHITGRDSILLSPVVGGKAYLVTPGLLCFVADSNKTYRLQANLTTWTEFGAGRIYTVSDGISSSGGGTNFKIDTTFAQVMHSLTVRNNITASGLSLSGTGGLSVVRSGINVNSPITGEYINYPDGTVTSLFNIAVTSVSNNKKQFSFQTAAPTSGSPSLQSIIYYLPEPTTPQALLVEQDILTGIRSGYFSALRVGASTTSGYVLTADASGNATWQAASGGGGTTTNPLTLSYGLTGTSFNGSSAVTSRVDTANIGTHNYINNFLSQALANSNFIPYSNANSDVNLNNKSLTNALAITSTSSLTKNLTIQDATSSNTQTITTNRLGLNYNIKLQSKSYTLADSADVANTSTLYLPKNNPVASGTFKLSSYTTAGAVLFTDATGLIGSAATGTSTLTLHGGTTPSFGSVVLTTDVGGILPVANGGTGSSSVNYVDLTTNQAAIAGNKTLTGILGTTTSSTASPRGPNFDQTSSDALGSRLNIRKIRGTGTVVTGDNLGGLNFQAYDGASYLDASRILSTTYGTIGTGITPATLSFHNMSAAGTLIKGLEMTSDTVRSFLPIVITNGGVFKTIMQRSTTQNTFSMANYSVGVGGLGNGVLQASGSQYYIGSDTGLSTGTNAGFNVAVSTTFKTTSSGTQYLFCYGAEGTSGFAARLSGSTLSIFLGSASNTLFTLPTYSDGVTHNITITVNNTTVLVYFDAGSPFTVTGFSSYTVSLNGTFKNNGAGNTFALIGTIGQQLVYNTTINSTDVSSIWHSSVGTLSPPQTGLVRAFYFQNFPTSTTCKDDNPTLGTQYNVTLTGSASQAGSGNGLVPINGTSGLITFFQALDALNPSSTISLKIGDGLADIGSYGNNVFTQINNTIKIASGNGGTLISNTNTDQTPNYLNALGVQGGTVLGSTDATTVTAPTDGLSVQGIIQGKAGIDLVGSTSGKVSVRTQAAAGTYNWNYPTTAGLSGQAMLSAAGSTNPMTWGYVTQSLFTNSATATVTNTTTESTILPTGVGSKTLPIATVGKQFRAIIGGVYSTPAITAGTLTFNVYYGSTLIATSTTSGLLASASNLSFSGNIKITTLSVGASGTVQVDGGIDYSVGNNLARFRLDLNNAGTSVTVTNNSTQDLEVKVIWDSASSSKIIKTTQFSLESLN